MAETPERRRVDTSARAPYQRSRAKCLTPDELAALVAGAASGRSLRSLATEFAITDETARTLLREFDKAA